MYRVFPVLLLLLSGFFSSHSQAVDERRQGQTGSWKGRPGRVDTAQEGFLVRGALARISYVQGGVGGERDLDTAFLLVGWAENINAQIKDPLYDGYIDYVNMLLYQACKEYQKADEYGNTAVRKLEAGKSDSLRAEIYLRLAYLMPGEPAAEKMKYLFAAGAAFLSAGDADAYAGVVGEIGNAYSADHHADSAARYYALVRERYQMDNDPYLYLADFYLAEQLSAMGNAAGALNYLKEGVALPEKGDSIYWKGNYYRLFSEIYFTQKDYSQSIYWSKKDMELCRYTHNYARYYACAHNIMNSLLAEKKPQQVFAVLDTAVRDINTMQGGRDAATWLALLQGKCYESVRQYSQAEPFYLKYDALVRSKERETGIVGVVGLFDYMNHQFELGRFYVSAGRYSRAAPYLRQVDSCLRLKMAEQMSFRSRIGELEKMESSIDSAGGRYFLAFRHLRAVARFDDSMYRITKSTQIAELNVRYRSDSDRIQIALLKNLGEKQRTDLQKVHLQRNFILAATALLFIIAGLAYLSYRLKQRSHRLLQEKQEEISAQKAELEQLLVEKEELLSEKEGLLEVKDILMQEIHHRVKNNLHMISSLLESQSAYLQDEALQAVQKSQHRVQAISLIHHKLYLSPDLTSLEMSVYLREMISYLRDSFLAGDRIVFEMDLDNIELDVAQAVPIGLIVNEAITNSLKYAFPDQRSGVIAVSMKIGPDHLCLLRIADNGVGLPADFKVGKYQSLGTKLMEAAGKNLKGRFRIYGGGQGTVVEVEFRSGLV